ANPVVKYSRSSKDVDADKSDFPSARYGIPNSGNSCYANSAMQVLMTMPDSFFDEAKKKYDQSTVDAEGISPEAEFLQEVFAFRDSWVSGESTQLSNQYGVESVIDVGINNGIYPNFVKGRQEDTTEFLTGI